MHHSRLEYNKFVENQQGYKHKHWYVDDKNCEVSLILMSLLFTHYNTTESLLPTLPLRPLLLL